MKIDQAKLNNFVEMGCANPFATTTENPWLGLNHQFLGMNDMMIQPQTNSIELESGLSNNLPNGPRKRSRDSMVQFNKNINFEFETQQDGDVKFMLASVTSQFVKRLKLKNDQISRMGKLNMALEERMNSLYAETQLWKDVANKAEVTAMTLRKDIDTILGKVSKLNGHMPCNAVAVDEEAESCCGSTDSGQATGEVGGGNRMCKKCRERESCVFLLPCRHLCLCSVCGRALQATCPVCNSGMTTTVHVNLT